MKFLTASQRHFLKSWKLLLLFAIKQDGDRQYCVHFCFYRMLANGPTEPLMFDETITKSSWCICLVRFKFLTWTLCLNLQFVIRKEISSPPIWKQFSWVECKITLFFSWHSENPIGFKLYTEEPKLAVTFGKDLITFSPLDCQSRSSVRI